VVRVEDPNESGAPVLIYESVDAIQAHKGAHSVDPGAAYEHRFHAKPKDYALPDATTITTPLGVFHPAAGSVLLTSTLRPANARTRSRFAALASTLAKRPDVQDPAALSAWIGRAKYGPRRFAAMAAAGRRRRHAS
jgi:hypothetical protein